MKRIMINIFKYLGLPALVFLIGVGGYLQAAELPKVIDKTNCDQYKDLFIPAMYLAVERGGWIINPGTINFKYKHEDKFVAASAKNAGKFDISPEGDLVEKATGKIPLYNIYGYPFPDIDVKDPKAGAKIIANFNWQVYRFMGSTLRRPLLWINPSGLERYIDGVDTRLYMSGRPPGQEIKRNPDLVLTYQFQNVLQPMTMKGTNTMSYIYMDKRDNTNYAYVPAIRRIRQTGSTTRSDPYMGSDAWNDMNFGWAGKDRSMKWKYLGEKTILAPFTSPNMIPVEELPDGRLATKYPYTGMVFKLGYEVPGWKGDAWAPAPGVITYVPRKVWIVEQIPKDPYYNWGTHHMYVDQETYTVWYKEVYEKSGDFRTWYITFLHYSESQSGKSNTGDADAMFFIDEKVHHATISSSAPSTVDHIYVPASKLTTNYFDVNNFLLLSK